MGRKRFRGETHEEREALWPLSSEERYISVDVETDGPAPGIHSMLSIGAAAYNAWGQRVGKVLGEPRDAARRHHGRPHDGLVGKSG